MEPKTNYIHNGKGTVRAYVYGLLDLLERGELRLSRTVFAERIVQAPDRGLPVTFQFTAGFLQCRRFNLCLLDVPLTNPTKTVAVMAHVQLRRQQTNERVLPVYYTDNYVSLLPGESRMLTIDAAARDLRGDTPLIVLDGWNTTVRAQSFPGAALAPNAAALVGHASAAN